MPTSSFDPLHTAIGHVLDGSAILFAGAGVSFLLTNAAKRKLPNGIALNKAFHEACGIDYPNYTLDRIPCSSQNPKILGRDDTKVV